MAEMDEEENEHWWQVMRTFLSYFDFLETELSRRQQHLNLLSHSHSLLLPALTFDKLALLHQAGRVNQTFFEDMVAYHASNGFLDPPAYAIQAASSETAAIYPHKDVGPRVDINQHHRNQAVLHSLYREWSAEGETERELSFGPLLAELVRRLPLQSAQKDEEQEQRLEDEALVHKVLVPGCGLGRLPLEIASRGYSCEGNEFSAYMAIASNFILNGVQEPRCYEIFPWIGSISNIRHVRDTLAPVSIPDITATSFLERFASQIKHSSGEPPFSMAAGDFVEIYASPDQAAKWDAVVTCFFLDTAPNVLAYLETIYRLLKPGGFWLNLGPLLYHWVADLDRNQDPRYDQSIELSYEELRHCIEKQGFSFLLEEPRECTYTAAPNSMMRTVYRSMQFTVQKTV